MSRELELIKEIDEHIEKAGGLYGMELPNSDLRIIRAALCMAAESGLRIADKIQMVSFEGNYFPRVCCSVTNPLTSQGQSEVDDIDLPCGQECEDDCDKCILQKIMNQYARITGQL